MQANKIKIKKGVEVLEIYPETLDTYWDLCDFMLREGLKYDGDPMSIEDLKTSIKEGSMQLHMMFGSDDAKGYKVFGVCVTRITALPNFNQCEVILLKGEKRASTKTSFNLFSFFMHLFHIKIMKNYLFI